MAIRKKPIKKVTFRINEMLTFVIAIYIMFVALQMWLLFGTINKALYLYNTEIEVQPYYNNYLFFLQLFFLIILTKR